MKLILARHGETAWNVEEIFRGRVDVELNETGIKQARLLADYLSETEIEAIYSSPLSRAVKTAEEIASHHNLKVEVSRGLIDIDFGGWSGLAIGEAESKYPDLYLEWMNNPQNVVFPGGESLDNIREMALALVEAAVSWHKGVVVLVSHRVVLKVIICALLGLDNSHFWNIRHDTCGITTFGYENRRFTLLEYNNTSYLKSVRAEKPADF